MKEKIRVLVVDDSFIVRRIVGEELRAQPDIEIVGEAATGRVAIDLVNALLPELIVLDVEMPEMDGLTALTKIHQTHPEIPIIMFSSFTELGASTTLEALARGAADFFTKPKGSGGLDASRQLIRDQLATAIRELTSKRRKSLVATSAGLSATTVARGNAPSQKAARQASRIDVVAIGASTGGPNALVELFAGLPNDLPVPIVVVQHMPPLFTTQLAQRLSRQSQIETFEADSGATLSPGKAWLAPGDHHLQVIRQGNRVVTVVSQGPREHGCRPAVDPLFRSVAETFGKHCLAVVLTGMGQDGMRGCESINSVGGQVIVQDEASSVVWGMPGAVVDAGLADAVLPLPMIAAEITRRARAQRG
jgi:two-component system, chemotaxis family, protein-glutamate methylesterase/glutaminase